jgi:hypothetical protein
LSLGDLAKLLGQSRSNGKGSGPKEQIATAHYCLSFRKETPRPRVPYRTPAALPSVT